MTYTIFTLISFLVLAGGVFSMVLDENKCSKFEYEYKILERILFLENKNAEVEKQQVVLSRKNEELVEIIKEQRLEMERLNEGQNEAREKLKSEVTIADSDLEKKIEMLDERIGKDALAIMGNITVLQQSQSDFEKGNEEIEGYIKTQGEKHEEDMERIRADLKEIESAVSEPVSRRNISFTARMQNLRFGRNSIFIFDNMINNDGNGYNPSTGKFTAPVDGKYLFSTTITMKGNNYVQVYLMKNNVDIGRLMTDKNNFNDYDAASVNAVVNLNQGDEVWVRIWTGATSYFYSNAYTSFSGVLIQS